MMVKGNVTLRDYTDEGLRDPAVLAMADRVSYRVDPDDKLPVGGHSALSRPTVEIRTRRGEVYRCKPDAVPGDPSRPVDDALLEAKFRDCVSFCVQPIPAANVDRAITLVRDLENVPDVTEIVRMLTPPVSDLETGEYPWTGEDDELLHITVRGRHIRLHDAARATAFRTVAPHP